jgi:hypothetical protein
MQFLFEGVAAHNYDTGAYIFSDSGGHPGDVLASSVRSFTPWNLDVGFYSYSFASPLSLDAGTTYWAGFGFATPSGAPMYISYAYNLSQFADNGVTPSLTFCTTTSFPPDPSATSTGQWGVNAPTQTLVYQLEGSVVPEPASAALTFLGFATLTMRRMWKQPD